jgi:hypothetical protein
MDEKDEMLNKSTATNVQLHEIKPVAEGMSFGALLDKFYLNSDAAKSIDAYKGAEVIAQDFINANKPGNKQDAKA